MENINCLFCKFPWDIFLFLLLLGLLLWWLLGWLLAKKYLTRIDDLQRQTAILKDDNSKLTGQVSSLKAELEECRKKKAAAPMAFAAKPKTIMRDDLKKVEGVGPKIEQLFNNDGIYSFDDLAKSSYDHLKKILDDAGSAYTMHDPTTWPEQAAMARDGKWDVLKKWQDELKGGKEE